jgi:hypothetical protein
MYRSSSPLRAHPRPALLEVMWQAEIPSSGILRGNKSKILEGHDIVVRCSGQIQRRQNPGDPAGLRILQFPESHTVDPALQNTEGNQIQGPKNMRSAGTELENCEIVGGTEFMKWRRQMRSSTIEE